MIYKDNKDVKKSFNWKKNSNKDMVVVLTLSQSRRNSDTIKT
jgi:hypothetical protein